MDLEPFIQEIIANPHDDVARLVFADFLEEQGDPRSEMIRLQFQLAELDQFDTSCPRLRRQELKLLKAHGTFGKAPTVAKVIGYHGGFVDAVELTVTRFLKLQDDVFQTAPIRELHLRAKSVKFHNIRESKWLGQLSTLVLDNNKASDEELADLISCSRLNRLERLEITSGDMSNAVIERAANAANLSNLKELSLLTWQIDHRSGRAIAESPVLRNLEVVTLKGDQSDVSLELLANSPNCEGLRKLSLSGFMTDAGIHALQHGRSCQKLESLDLLLRNQSLVNAFDVSQPFNSLKSLTLTTGRYELEGEQLPSDVLERTLKCCPSLETLGLASNQLTSEETSAIANSPALSKLKKIVLTGNQITMSGVIAIVESPHFQKKTKLYLRSNFLSVSEIRELRDRFGKTFGNMEPERELQWRERYGNV